VAAVMIQISEKLVHTAGFDGDTFLDELHGFPRPGV
jgi:hypothetical protein